MPNWRSHAAEIISKIIGARVPRRMSAEELKSLRKEISDAYPFGQRAMHPYKIWCSEVKNQLKLPKEIDADMPLFGEQ